MEAMVNKDKDFYKFIKKRAFRETVSILSDILCIILAIFMSSRLLNIDYASLKDVLILLGIYILFHIVMFKIFNCYDTLWRYAGEEGFISLFFATISYSIVVFIINILIGYKYPAIFYLLNTIFIVTFTLGYRLIHRAIKITSNKSYMKGTYSNILVIGAGDAGGMVVQELKRIPRLKKLPVAIIDDDPDKWGRAIHNVKIVGGSSEILEIVEKYKIDEIIFSIANIDKQKKKIILDICKSTNCKVKTIPGIYEIIDGRVNIRHIRDVRIEDLLGRDPIEVDYKDISNYIEGKSVIVTGGGGSIGSELCRQIASFNPSKLIILDNYENNAYAIQQELIRKYGDKLDLDVVIASIREKNRLDEIFNEYRPQIVFHAAAHKHVPLMESSPSEAIKNNIFGTLNTAKVADKYKAERFVLISTDKAVNPTNIMGATKRAAEMIIQTMNEESDTDYVAVRFGNVLGSNGSVIPLFKKQIEDGGPVTVTHPMIIRYFMTIPEAVGLVIQAGAMAKGGEIFVLDMGEPVKILDLANNLIKFSGFEPGVDIKIKFTGLRPGEKLYEELLMSEEGLLETKHKKIFIGEPININKEKIIKIIKELQEVTEAEETNKIDSLMKTLVTTYISAEEANEREIAITKIED